MTFERSLAVCLLLLGGATAARATDPWEADVQDGGSATRGVLLPGQSQTGRDLEATAAAPDVDQVWIATVPRHSYEARAVGGVIWSQSGGPGARLERLNPDLSVQQEGNDVGLPSLRGHSIKWHSGIGPTTGYLRVTGPSGVAQGPAPYTLQLFDTTYAFPRWNNSSTQVTVFFLQNHTASLVGAFVFFYNAAGVLLHTEPIGIPADGLAVFNTSTVTALAGQSGSARISQMGGVDALSGKAVSLEPTTGFTFDTALVPVQP